MTFLVILVPYFSFFFWGGDTTENLGLQLVAGFGLELDVLEMPAHFMERWAYDARTAMITGDDIFVPRGGSYPNPRVVL